jgi:hypothetical protein
MREFQSIPHCHKDGQGLSAFQIHRLWQQVFVDRFTYGPGTIDNAETGPYSPPAFTRQQLQFLAGAAEIFGMICYDAGFWRGQAKAEGRSEPIKGSE